MLKLIFPYYRNQTGNMGLYYPLEGVPLTYTRAPNTSCALRVFALNAHLRIFLNLKPVIRFNITWLSTNRMKYLCLPSDKCLYSHLPKDDYQ